MSFYSLDRDKLEQDLRAVLSYYSHCVLIGNCMGATAALRFAHLLPSRSSTVLAFNPEVSPALDFRRPSFLLAALLQPLTSWRLRGELQAAARGSRGRVQVHCSTWPPELAQARLLKCDVELRHLCGVELPGESGGRGSALREVEITEGLLERPCAVRLVHDECSTHGLLSKVLQPSGSLSALVERAVCDTRRDRP